MARKRKQGAVEAARCGICGGFEPKSRELTACGSCDQGPERVHVCSLSVCPLFFPKEKPRPTKTAPRNG